MMKEYLCNFHNTINDTTIAIIITTPTNGDYNDINDYYNYYYYCYD